MVNIVISQNGRVTGDCGKIVAYEGQDYSEVINITHPIFPSAQYYIEYKYKDTIYRNKLDANNQTSIEVRDAGYVKCQLVALDIQTGDIIFKSQTWDLIVKRTLKIENSHYPCNSLSHYYKHHPSEIIASHKYTCNNAQSNNKLDEILKTIQNVSEKLDNEEDIRFNEMQAIRQEIAEIKAYVNMNDAARSTLNADTIITVGHYKANELSIGFPEKNKGYDLVVSCYDENRILQHAYELTSNKVYYRSATIINESIPEWDNEWTLLSLQ